MPSVTVGQAQNKLVTGGNPGFRLFDVGENIDG